MLSAAEAPAQAQAQAETTKPCRLCSQTKPLTQFYRDSKNKDGHKNTCKDCSRDLESNWRARRTGQLPGSAPKTFAAGGLKEVRERLGLTQEEMARAVGCSSTTVSNLENNVKGASRSLCVELIAFVANEKRRREGRSEDDRSASGGYEAI